MEINFFKKINRKISAFVKDRCHDMFERQQFIVYVASIVLTLSIIPFHFLGMIGAPDRVLRFLSVLLICSEVFPLTFFILGWMRIGQALGWFGIVFQAVQAAKVIYIAVALPELTHLILVNEFISLMAITIMAMCYITHATMIMAGIFVLTILVGNFFNKNFDVSDFNFIFVAFILYLCLLAPTMIYNINKVRKENEKYKEGEATLLKVVRMNRKEIYNYVSMSRNDSPTQKEVDDFFALLNDRAKRNLIRAMEMKLASDNAKEDNLRRIFPEFTPSELQVSSLIIQGKKLSEICKVTGKSENNISTVRSHIRKKLGLGPNDDLFEALTMQL